MYNIIADLHTHSLASNHAYSTVLEMTNSAKEKGLKAIAITDHTRAMPGSVFPWHFTSLRDMPLLYHDVLFLAGMEANVSDFEGGLDVTPLECSKMDWIVASIHEGLRLEGLKDPTVEKCTQLWLNIAKNPDVCVIGHSGSAEYKYDYETVIPEFGRQHKLVEINSHSFEVRKGNIPNCREIALCCKKHGVPIIVSSDAHNESEVKNHVDALQMLEEIDFPEELIVNADLDRLLDYLCKYTKVLSNRKNAEDIIRSFRNA